MDDVFEELLKNTEKRTYDDYLQDDCAREKSQVHRGIALEKEIIAGFEQYVRERGHELGLELVTVSGDAINQARKDLYQGKVIAVDGGRDKPRDIVSGVFCEVGIATVGYKTMNEPEIRCFSITSHISEAETKEEYYESSRKGRVNENEITNAMIFWELETCV